MKIKDLIRAITSGLKDSYDTYAMPMDFKEVIQDLDAFFRKEEIFLRKIKLDLTKEELMQLTTDGKELNRLQNKIEEECVNIAKSEFEKFIKIQPEKTRRAADFDKSNFEKQKNVINAFCAVFSRSMLFFHPVHKKIINEKYLGCNFFEYDAYTMCLLEGSLNSGVNESQYKTFVLRLKMIEIALKLRNNGVSEKKIAVIRDINKKLNQVCKKDLFDLIYSYNKLSTSKEIFFDNTKEDLILLDFINLSETLDSGTIANIVWSYFYMYQAKDEIISEMDDKGLKDLTPLTELIQRNIKAGATGYELTALIDDLARGKRKITYNEKANNIK